MREQTSTKATGPMYRRRAEGPESVNTTPASQSVGQPASQRASMEDASCARASAVPPVRPQDCLCVAGSLEWVNKKETTPTLLSRSHCGSSKRRMSQPPLSGYEKRVTSPSQFVRRAIQQCESLGCLGCYHCLTPIRSTMVGPEDDMQQDDKSQRKPENGKKTLRSREWESPTKMLERARALTQTKVLNQKTRVAGAVAAATASPISASPVDSVIKVAGR